MGLAELPTSAACRGSSPPPPTIRTDTLARRFETHAPRLAAQAGQRALDDAGLAAREVDAIVVSTCTGALCPGLTGHVVERLGLRPDVLTHDLVGQGCAAALPNLQRRLELQPENLRHSADMLRQHGNLSSAFVYFVLQAALAEPAAAGGWWWLSSFGAGFACHGALLEVR